MSLNRIHTEPGRIIWLREIDSTNDEARRRIEGETSPDPPFTIVAARQTTGRGRGQNLWYTDAGSLIQTTAFNPRDLGLRTEHEPRLALAFAACLTQILEADLSTHLGSYQLGIRWPNDLEAGGLKFGGILPERVVTARGPAILFGVGINVSTNFDHAPRDVRRIATSLKAITAHLVDPDPFFLACHTYKALEQAVTRLAADDPTLPEQWAARDTLLGKPIHVRLPDRVIHGLGAGIDPEGRLRVATEQGIDSITGGTVLREQ